MAAILFGVNGKFERIYEHLRSIESICVFVVFGVFGIKKVQVEC